MTFSGKLMEPAKLGKRIKIARVEQDLTQGKLAELIGVQQESISRYETGASAPSIETLMKIAKALNKPVAHFLE